MPWNPHQTSSSPRGKRFLHLLFSSFWNREKRQRSDLLIMCQGRHLRGDLRRPADAAMMSPERRQLDSTNDELVAARERLVESMAQLERERARAADLRRRLVESYAERDRLRKLASVMDIIRYRLVAKKLRLVAAASRNPAA